MKVEIKCPFCGSGFLEEMGSMREVNNNGFDLGLEVAFSLWDIHSFWTLWLVSTLLVHIV
jgi:hypothetical protein